MASTARGGKLTESSSISAAMSGTTQSAKRWKPNFSSMRRKKGLKNIRRIEKMEPGPTRPAAIALPIIVPLEEEEVELLVVTIAGGCASGDGGKGWCKGGGCWEGLNEGGDRGLGRGPGLGLGTGGGGDGSGKGGGKLHLVCGTASTIV